MTSVLAAGGGPRGVLCAVATACVLVVAPALADNGGSGGDRSSGAQAQGSPQGNGPGNGPGSAQGNGPGHAQGNAQGNAQGTGPGNAQGNAARPSQAAAEAGAPGSASAAAPTASAGQAGARDQQSVASPPSDEGAAGDAGNNSSAKGADSPGDSSATPSTGARQGERASPGRGRGPERSADSAVTAAAPPATVAPQPAAAAPTRPRRTRRASTGSRREASRSAAPAARGGPAVTPDAPSTGSRSSSRPARERSSGSRRTAATQPQVRDSAPQDDGRFVLRRVVDVVEEVPTAIKWLVGGLGVLVAALLVAWWLVASRARRLVRQREALLAEKGLLQAALLPNLPEDIGGVPVSAAYRPADGPGAGGDFYDAFPLADGRTGLVIGDVCGHGSERIAITSWLRYSLRAHLESGAEPRRALELVGSLADSREGAELTSAATAIFDPQTGILTYALAGHHPPIVLMGPEPIIQASSPPLGSGFLTGRRQTTIALRRGAIACFLTDGVVEARRGHGTLGREAVAQELSALAPRVDAGALLRRVRARADRTPDDMAVCLLRAPVGASGPVHIEELVLPGAVNDEALARALLEACGLSPDQIVHAISSKPADTPAILRVELPSGRWSLEPLTIQPSVLTEV